MTKSKFGELLPGTPFEFGGTQYVKIVPFKDLPYNSVELGTHERMWGTFFNDVIVEVEDEHVAPKENRLTCEVYIHNGAIFDWNVPESVTLYIKDYDCPDDYEEVIEDKDGNPFQQIVIKGGK